MVSRLKSSKTVVGGTFAAAALAALAASTAPAAARASAKAVTQIAAHRHFDSPSLKMVRRDSWKAHTRRVHRRAGQRIGHLEPQGAGQPAQAAASQHRLGSSSGTPSLVTEARRFLGATAADLGLPSRLWCADFVNFLLRRNGEEGTGSRAAKSFASYGRRVSGPQVGAIAVMRRGKGGGHVGVVSGVDSSGNPIIISGNWGRRVAEAKVPRERVYAYVMPD